MNIIVVGIGNVGYIVTEVLSQYHDVMIIDNDKATIEKAKSLLNVSVLYEDGSNPKVLRSAIERHNVDIVVSTTGRDDDNLLISMLSKMIKPGIKTIVRVRNPDFAIEPSPETVDQIISPEIMIANKMAELALLENAVDYESIEAMDLGLALFEVTDDHKEIIGKMSIDIKKPKDCTIVAIYRDDEIIIEHDMTVIHVGDLIRVLGSPESIHEFNDMMGVSRPANEFAIIGGGVAGSQTAKLLESRKRYVKLIESDRKRCTELAKELTSTVIVNGSGVDPYLLKSENAGRADVIIASTDTDETNLLSGLMGKKLGAYKIVSRYSMIEYEDIFEYTGIKTIVGNHRVIANGVTKTLISSDKAILKMRNPDELFFTVNVNPRSDVCNEHTGDVKLPKGCRLTCIIRNDEKVYPDMYTKFQANDRAILYTHNANKSKLERMFGTRIDIDV